jgi:hypothetical protein
MIFLKLIHIVNLCPGDRANMFLRKFRYQPNKLHDVITQKTIRKITAVKTSNLALVNYVRINASVATV